MSSYEKYEAEEKIIGICLVDSNKLPYITSALSPKDFRDNFCRLIYKSILSIYKSGGDVDIVTVSDRLSKDKLLKSAGGRPYINDLALNITSTSNFKSYIKLIMDGSKRLQLKSLANDILSIVDTVDDIDNLAINLASDASRIMGGGKEDTTVSHVSSGAMDVYDKLSSIFENKASMGVPSGYGKLDRMTGGFIGGKIYVLGGRSSMGKSSLALNIAENIAKLRNVLFISVEMSQVEYAQRLMYAKAGTNSDMVNQGEVTEATLSSVAESLKYLSSLNLFIQDKTPCRVSDIEMGIINLISSQGSCGLVVIDYLQLLKPDFVKGRSREQELALMSGELKSLARKYNVPILVLAQLSRALEAREDKRPMQSDLRESGAIEQDADVVMFVYRDEYYYPNKPEAKGKAEIIIRKNRDGRCGIIPMLFNGSRCQFTEERIGL